MYREKDLIDCLFGLVGWRQNINPDYEDLISSLLQSDTGMYFQDGHKLITIENLDQAFKNFDTIKYADWSNATTYKEGARVKGSDGKNYESLEDDNLNQDPTTTPAAWSIIMLFSEALTNLTRASISKVLSRMFIEKKIDGVTKSIFENIQLFTGAGSLQNKEIAQGRFVGFEIILNAHRDITTIIRRIGTQFTTPNPDLDIYLFHSSQEDPVKKWNLNLLKGNYFEWSALQDDDLKDWALKFLDPKLQPGGSFYLGYYEDGLPGMAINRFYDFANPPTCSSCNNDWNYWRQWSQYMVINPFEIGAEDLTGIKPADVDGPKLWDIRKNRYQFGKNYGLNLDLSVKCDVTDFFCRERVLFADAILKQTTHDVLETIAYSTRNNAISKETKDLAMFELNVRKPNAVTNLENSIKAVSFDMSDLNEACLPCNTKGGVSWGNV